MISIAGTKHYLWRAVDQDGFVLDVLVQSRRDKRAAKRLLRKLLKKQGRAPPCPDHRQTALLRGRQEGPDAARRAPPAQGPEQPGREQPPADPAT
ncbi:hypothetical protein M2351_007064 [Azospirillum canadense]|nr:hypothetical protein [Azospirillum canadense]